MARTRLGIRRLAHAGIACGAVVLSTFFATPSVSIHAFVIAPTTTRIVFVDDDAPQGGDGTTWTTAHKFLQDGLTAARAMIAAAPSDPPPFHVEIRIGGGTHKPDQGAGLVPANTNATFLVTQGMSVRGGYAGFGAADPDARDFVKFESILSGDLLGNDPPIVWPPPPQTAMHAENSLHIMTVQDADGSTIIEGITCTKSRYLESQLTNLGGGVLCIGGTPTIRQCLFRHNRAYQGGGIGVFDGNTRIEQCTFFQNWGAHGGGVHFGGFVGAVLSPGDGTIVDCTFTQNRSGGSFGGGAVKCTSGSVVIEHCNFAQNVAPNAAIGGAVSSNSDTTIQWCRFIANYGDMGGAVFGPDLPPIHVPVVMRVGLI